MWRRCVVQLAARKEQSAEEKLEQNVEQEEQQRAEQDYQQLLAREADRLSLQGPQSKVSLSSLQFALYFCFDSFNWEFNTCNFFATSPNPGSIGQQ